MQQSATGSLYTRLGGYDAIAAVVDDLLARLRSDALLGRYWTSPRSVVRVIAVGRLALTGIAMAVTTLAYDTQTV